MRRGRSPCRLGLVAWVAAGGDEENGDGCRKRVWGFWVRVIFWAFGLWALAVLLR
jgi:hypothetical protein